MTRPSIRTLPLLFAAVALGGCADGSSAAAPKPGGSGAAAAASAPSALATSAPAAPPPAPSPTARPTPAAPPPMPAEALLSAWNTALDRRDAAALAPLYAPRVHFYGRWRTAAEVTSAKRSAFDKQPDFRQRIDDVHVSKTDKGFVAVFQKHSGASFASTVEGRLTLEPSAGGLVIAEESDSITDDKLRRPPRSSCADEAFRIVGEQPAISADRRRVASEMPDARPGGVTFEEGAHHLSAAEGYFLLDRFDRRWNIEVANGALAITDALTMEELPLTAEQRERIGRACASGRAINDGGR